jgi:CDP-diacylglycerol--glycerol-3-phosphate 3-phosphatidyltransferase
LNREFFYISNLISFSRFILLALAVHFLFEMLYLHTAIVIVLMWISDLLDGFFARSRNEISELGKIIDPLADKISIAVITLVLLFQHVIPLWFVIITLLRDLIIFSGGLYLKLKKNNVLQSNWTGKITVFLIGFTLLIFVIMRWAVITYPAYHIEFVELLSKIFILLSIVMSVVSLIVYSLRFNRAMK